MVIKTLSFSISCIPPKATSQQKGVMVIGGHPRFFKKKHVKQAEASLMSMLMPHRPAVPFTGPVKLTVYWTYPWRKSEKKSVIAQGCAPCDTRPDASNLIKMFEDCLTTLNFWNDDSQVYSLTFSKWWGNVPGIEVRIEGRES
jgi:Holliday junction resolvase RusA-like endonuclease